MIDENLDQLGQELKREPNVTGYVGQAYQFQNDTALRRVLLGATSFIAESRSCFENLADFYREFMRHYFGESVSEKQSLERIAQSTSGAKWAENLRGLRHDVLHDRAPWLAFELTGGTSPFEPVLVLDWRVGSQETGDAVSFETLRQIRAGLVEAVLRMRDELVDRVNAAQSK